MALGEPRCPICGHGPGAQIPAMWTQTTHARPPVLCPVCKGKTRVKNDFYPVGVGESALAAEYVTCRTCNGKGVV